jgi:uncharacterized repeat protein (TIGR03803 family)
MGSKRKDSQFPREKDGYDPWAGLIFDTAGNLYGTTRWGGVHGYGTVFQLAPGANGAWTENILHSFVHNNQDGVEPFAGLIFDTDGNLYGTTLEGGSYADGTVFQLAPEAKGKWKEGVLHRFRGRDGVHPIASLIFDATGNLYGTTTEGGLYNYGTVFRLVPGANGAWTENVLHKFFDNHQDGFHAGAALIFDAAGNLYGTTAEGGAYDYGTVFEIVTH